MENKYQVSLDYIKHNLEHLRYEAIKSKQTAPFIPDEYFDTLQELVDDNKNTEKLLEIYMNHITKLETALDLACIARASLNSSKITDEDIDALKTEYLRMAEKIIDRKVKKNND